MEPNPSRILIVDDSKLSLRLLSEIPKDEFEVKGALSGKEALSPEVLAPMPDLIILDITMPGLDGFQIIEILKSNHRTKDIPIIFVSARQEKEALLKGFELGAVDYIFKPFEADVVRVRVRTHIENHQLKKRLAQKAKAMEQFADNAAHDFRSPLNQIEMALELIGKDPSQSAELLEMIGNSTLKLRELMDSLMLLAEARPEKLVWDEIELSQLFEGVIGCITERIEHSSAQVKLEGDGTLHGDVKQLEILLRILICNAIRFSPEGHPPEVVVRWIGEAGLGFEVSDNGPGFDASLAGEIFEPFRLFHEHDKSHGLGLSICQKIARLHGGEISVESQPGQGATFYVHFPHHEAQNLDPAIPLGG